MGIKLSSERERRVLDNQRLVYYFVNKLNVSSNEFEDVVQEGMIGLIKAAETFDETKKIRFATYASRCINNQIYMYLRRINRHRNILSLNEPINQGSDGNEITLQDTVGVSSLNFIENIENTEELENAISIILNCFQGKERAVLLFSMKGSTQKEIANCLKCSQSYVSRLQRDLGKCMKQYVLSGKKVKKKLFLVKIIDKVLRIAFSTTDVEMFNKAFASFLSKFGDYEKEQNFKITYENKKIVMHFLVEPENFAFIAEILQEIENFVVESKNIGQF